MIDPANVPAVAADELLARFILHSSHIRRSDQSIKPDAFIPHPYRDLSVTRHLHASEEEIWSVAKEVARAQNCVLYGRSDVQAAAFLKQRLAVVPDPIENNPNHANVSGWPADKPEQKIIALEISAEARFVAGVI